MQEPSNRAFKDSKAEDCLSIPSPHNPEKPFVIRGCMGGALYPIDGQPEKSYGGLPQWHSGGLKHTHGNLFSYPILIEKLKNTKNEYRNFK